MSFLPSSLTAIRQAAARRLASSPCPSSATTSPFLGPSRSFVTLQRTFAASGSASCSSSSSTPHAPSPMRLSKTPIATNARSFSSSPAARHGGITRPEPGKGIKVTFRDSKGNDIRTVEVNQGDDLLSIAHEYDIDLEGACEGSIACSTCHVILDPSVYDQLPEPGDDENDMLDLAFGLTDTSRLGCQVIVTKELDGMVAQLPSATRNMYVDGAKAGHGH